MIDFYDIHQSREIARAQSAASLAQSKIGSVQEAINTINRRIDRLKLVNQAMWELIRDNTAMSEQHIADKVKEIDARDGQLDGKTKPDVKTCQKCGRTLQTGHESCLYCGDNIGYENIFEWVR